MEIFLTLFSNNDSIDKAIEYFETHRENIDQSEFYSSFIEAAYNGDLFRAQWLYNNGNRKFNHTGEENRAFWYACHNGHLEMAKWLAVICDIKYNKMIFQWEKDMFECPNFYYGADIYTSEIKKFLFDLRNLCY